MWPIESQPAFPQVENVQIELLLGEGASSTVYRGTQRNFERTIAIKVLKVANPGREELDRFHLEARILARLEHQNIARIWQVGLTTDTEQPYIVMELVEGQPLSALLKSGHRLNTQELRSILLPLLQALAVVHHAGIVHRDLKPGNIILSTSASEPLPVPKLIDFGIAKVRKSNLETECTTTITDERPILGSAAYMSPEQCSGQRITAQSDIYALGCILFECVTGSRLHDRATVAETMLCQINEASPTSKELIKKYKIPEELANCIARCLNKTPGDRFESVSQLEQALDNALTNDAALPIVFTDKPQSQLRWKVAAIATSLIVLVSALTVAILKRQQSTTMLPVDRGHSTPTHGQGYQSARTAADTAYNSNNYQKALPLYRQALARYSDKDSAHDVFDTYRSACDCAKQLELTAKEEKEKHTYAKEELALLQRALNEAIRRQEFGSIYFGAILRALCSFYSEHGRIDEAEKLLRTFPLPPDSPAHRQVTLSLIDTLLKKQKFQEGLELAQKLARSGKDKSPFVVCMALTYVYAFRKNLKLPVTEVGKETIELLETSDMTKSDRGTIAGMLAEYCFMFNDFDLCLKLLRDPIISKTREDNGDMFFLLIRRARALALSGHPAEAEKLLADTQRQSSGLTIVDRHNVASEISKLKQELATGRKWP